MNRYITCTADHFKQPIADLVVKLLGKDENRYTDLDSIYPLIILSVAIFEAYMVRALFFATEKSIPKNVGRHNGLSILKEKFPGYGEGQLRQVEEVYILRDVLTHNHLWECEQDSAGREKPINQLFGGDKKYRELVDFECVSPITKCLKLPVFPGAQDRQTAKISFLTLWDALEHVSAHQPNVLNREIWIRISNEYVRKKLGVGFSVNLKQLVEFL